MRIRTARARMLLPRQAHSRTRACRSRHERQRHQTVKHHSQKRQPPSSKCVAVHPNALYPVPSGSVTEAFHRGMGGPVTAVTPPFGPSSTWLRSAVSATIRTCGSSTPDFAPRANATSPPSLFARPGYFAWPTLVSSKARTSIRKSTRQPGRSTSNRQSCEKPRQRPLLQNRPASLRRSPAGKQRNEEGQPTLLKRRKVRRYEVTRPPRPITPQKRRGGLPKPPQALPQRQNLDQRQVEIQRSLFVASRATFPFRHLRALA